MGAGTGRTDPARGDALRRRSGSAFDSSTARRRRPRDGAAPTCRANARARTVTRALRLFTCTRFYVYTRVPQAARVAGRARGRARPAFRGDPSPSSSARKGCLPVTSTRPSSGCRAGPLRGPRGRVLRARIRPARQRCDVRLGGSEVAVSDAVRLNGSMPFGDAYGTGQRHSVSVGANSVRDLIGQSPSVVRICPLTCQVCI